MGKFVTAVLLAFGVSVSANAGLVEGAFQFTLDSWYSGGSDLCNDDLGVSSAYGACDNTGSFYFTLIEGDPESFAFNVTLDDTSIYGDPFASIISAYITTNLDTTGDEVLWSLIVDLPPEPLSIRWEELITNDHEDTILFEFSTLGYLIYAYPQRSYELYFTPNLQTLEYTVTEVPVPPALAFLVLLGMIPIFKRSKKLAG